MIDREQAREIKRVIRSWMPIYKSMPDIHPDHDLRAAVWHYRPTHNQLGRAVVQMRNSVKPARLAIRELRTTDEYEHAILVDDVVTALGDLIDSGDDEVMVDHYAHKDDDLPSSRRRNWRFE